MIRDKKAAFFLAAALALCAAGRASLTPEAAAQTSFQSDPQSQKTIKTRFEVLRMMYQSIQVRSLADMREIHTFTFAPEIRGQMEKILNQGGYQYGDKVVVWYQPGANVALKIKGKPSRPH